MYQFDVKVVNNNNKSNIEIVAYWYIFKINTQGVSSYISPPGGQMWRFMQNIHFFTKNVSICPQNIEY